MREKNDGTEVKGKAGEETVERRDVPFFRRVYWDPIIEFVVTNLAGCICKDEILLDKY